LYSNGFFYVIFEQEFGMIHDPLKIIQIYEPSGRRARLECQWTVVVFD